MIDPFAEVVTLLQPSAPLSKVVSGAGAWRVDRSLSGQPFFCVLLEGSSRLAVGGQEPIDLREGDFVLVPSTYHFVMASGEPDAENVDLSTVTKLTDEIRHGNPDGPPDVRLLAGHFVFGSPDAALLVSLLPQVVHVRGEKRLATLVQLVGEEARTLRPARDMILARLLEVLLIEALRSTAGATAPPGLLRGLADGRLAAAIRRMHENPTQDWTVGQLAQEAALSRSAFFDRFRRAMGTTPMEYLLAWRMALAKNFLRRNEGGMKEIAERVGYSSASAFSVAFTRFVGLPPTRFAQEETKP